jgi:hypothetical protein
MKITFDAATDALIVVLRAAPPGSARRRSRA